jgi:hypothetical protein
VPELRRSLARLISRAVDWPRRATRSARERGGRLIASDVVRRGAPGLAVAALAAIALGAILVAVKDRSEQRAQDFHAVAEVFANRAGCAIEPAVRSSATGCAVTGPRTISVTFRDSLLGRTAIVSRQAVSGTAVVAGGIVAPRVVVVRFSRLTRRPARVSILVP